MSWRLFSMPCSTQAHR